MDWKLTGKFSVLVLLLLSQAARAEINSIRLSGQAQPGCWDLAELVGKVIEGKSSDREKALALHAFGMAHQIHFIGPYEGGLEVDDPLKLIAVYGYNLCGNNSSTMCALYNLAGLKARRRGLTGHVVPEVWFEDRWNYIDTDMFGYVYLPDDKTIASVDELVARPQLFERAGRKSDPCFPWDSPKVMEEAFTNIAGWTDCHPYSLGHIISLSLRTGESFTCYYRPRDRFYLDPQCFPEELSTVYRDYWVSGPVRLNSLAWADSLPASYANGLLSYRPDLRSASFRAENPLMENIQAGRTSEAPELTAAAGTTASLVFEVSAPFVIAGLQNDLTNFEDNTEGAMVSGLFWRPAKEDMSRIQISTDHGVSWTTVWENSHLGAVPFNVDLTRWAGGCYGYQLKFVWTDRGGTGKAGLEGLKVDTWVELSPMALPRLEPGKNTFQVSTGDHRAVSYECWWREGESLPGEKRENLAGKGDETALYPAESPGPGVLIFTPGTEGIIDELRVSLLARKLKQGAPKDIKAVLYLSENKGRTWSELESFTPEPEHTLEGAWFNHIMRGRSISGAESLLKLEISGGGLAKVAVSSLVRASLKSPSTLRINHVYHQEGGARQIVNWLFPPGAQNSSYEVEVPEGKIHNESLTFEALPPDAAGKK